MKPADILKQSWLEAGYPPPAGPLVAMLEKVAEPIYAAFEQGDDEFIVAGWQAAGQDFPFAQEHPRYQALVTAYRGLARPN